MEAAQRVVAEELARGMPQWEDLPADLKPALQRHCDMLVKLAVSLQAAGRDKDVIRNMVSELLKSYGSDLVTALESRQ